MINLEKKKYVKPEVKVEDIEPSEMIARSFEAKKSQEFNTVEWYEEDEEELY